MAEVDEVMVRRLIETGPDRRASRAERQAAIEALLRERHPQPYRVIALRVGVNVRTVQRRASAIGIARPPKLRGAIGETRERVRLAVLADPTLNCSALSRSFGMDRNAAGRHRLRLEAAGELPARPKESW